MRGRAWHGAFVSIVVARWYPVSCEHSFLNFVTLFICNLGIENLARTNSTIAWRGLAIIVTACGANLFSLGQDTVRSDGEGRAIILFHSKKLLLRLSFVQASVDCFHSGAFGLSIADYRISFLYMRSPGSVCCCSSQCLILTSSLLIMILPIQILLQIEHRGVTLILNRPSFLLQCLALICQVCQRCSTLRVRVYLRLPALLYDCFCEPSCLSHLHVAASGIPCGTECLSCFRLFVSPQLAHDILI